MPTVPPPPPPPPISKPGTTSSFKVLNATDGNGNKAGNEMEELPPVGHTETREISKENFVNEVCELIKTRLEGCEEVKLVITSSMKTAILQNGPMCGIVALAEAVNLLHPDEKVSTEELLNEAVQAGWTKQGEMFSIKNMQSLATKFNCGNSRVLGTADNSHFLHTLSHILEGYPVLIPYDADYNHSPALRKGHAAHWAVIYGVACNVPKEMTDFLNLSNYFKVILSSPDMLILQPTGDFKDAHEDAKQLLDLFPQEKLNVFAHQGKSYHLALWKYNDLIKSNQNLKEISPKILANKPAFICEDIVDGLCSKILLIK